MPLNGLVFDKRDRGENLRWRWEIDSEIRFDLRPNNNYFLFLSDRITIYLLSLIFKRKILFLSFPILKKSYFQYHQYLK